MQLVRHQAAAPRGGEVRSSGGAQRGPFTHCLTARRAIFVVCAAACFGFALSPTPAVAFLDFLFGRSEAPASTPAPAPAPEYSSTPLGVSVQPRRGKRANIDRSLYHNADQVFRRPRDLSRRHAKPEQDQARAGRGDGRLMSRQVSLNPKTTPDWHLQDPNIQYGDIIVLESGPVVYQGHKQKRRAREDFVSLDQSHLASSRNFREIRMMASGVWTPPEAGAELQWKARGRSRGLSQR
jgi:hypothetical protein